MIRFPKDTDLPQIKALWQEAFGDSDEDTEFYFERRHRHENMLVLLEGDEVAAMLTMLPINLKAGKEGLKARYIFAVATKKSHRGQGLSTKLLEAAHEFIRSEGGAAGVLVPAEGSLFDFYEKRGYQTAFYIDEAVIPAAQLPKISTLDSVFDCSASEYLSSRENLLGDNRMYVKWDLEALTYIKDSLGMGGGRMLKLTIDKKPALAVCAPVNDGVMVTELLCEKSHITRALAQIHNLIRAERYTVRTPQGVLGEGEKKSFGMIHRLGTPVLDLDGQLPYLSFAKD